jgi:hypothetical protein
MLYIMVVSVTTPDGAYDKLEVFYISAVQCIKSLPIDDEGNSCSS